jgi:hypothetical protein
MLIQAQVGPAVSSTSLGVGTQPNLRLDNLGGLTATQLLPRYYESTYRRQMYTVANQSGVTTSAGLSTTYVGLCIANPTTSTVNAVITKLGYAFTVAPGNPMTVGIMTGVGASISTNLVTARNRFVGGVGAQCLASTSLTLPGTPVLETVVGSVLTGAITTQSQQAPTLLDLEGSLILPPGAFAAFYTSTASGASAFFGSFQWVEVPL